MIDCMIIGDVQSLIAHPRFTNFDQNPKTICVDDVDDVDDDDAEDDDDVDDNDDDDDDADDDDDDDDDLVAAQLSVPP